MASVSQDLRGEDHQDITLETALEEKEAAPRFGSLHFDRKGANLGLGKNQSSEEPEKESKLKYQNLENDEGDFQSNGSSLNTVFRISWTRHPLIQKNRKVVLASFLLLTVGLVLVFTGMALQVNPTAGLSSAIFFVPGFLLLIPGVYHVTFIYCAVRGKKGFRFFYLPYFEK
ncbi:transmembrane protein 134 isoform X2 [Latimeria chalumnae]|uniref:transmembrane protein 134 isoform X2 n=1 Tax=Latimeria chalumnae TaxID=7897 RepID=UPI0003C13623|nr:PREDICTED: transmembrane protein 134 isoform X2 [Latimeria chalumnae]|eukprot:XP_006013321.1 PREDICTED: transmembrane protein 134 isoform X2 [Latimeria chalumnae]